MALGQYIAGMGFSNVGLGIDHAMAHTLSAHYDTPYVDGVISFWNTKLRHRSKWRKHKK